MTSVWEPFRVLKRNKPDRASAISQIPLEELGTAEVDGQSSGSDQHPKSPSRSLLSAWKWEVMGLVIAVMSMLALFAILSQYQHRPKPKWPYFITINTIISIFTTLLKACMLLAVAECLSQLKWLWFENTHPVTDIEKFDQASRGGPIGASRLLFTLRMRHTAVLGALIIVLSIGVDPFAQQSVQYYQCPRISNNGSIASVPIAKHFFGELERDPTIYSLSSPGITGAVYDGLLSLGNNITAVLANCPSANCNISETYQSLGVCSRCTNLAQYFEVTWFNQTRPGNVCTNSFLSLNITAPGYNTSTINSAENGSPNNCYISMPFNSNQSDMFKSKTCWDNRYSTYSQLSKGIWPWAPPPTGKTMESKIPVIGFPLEKRVVMTLTNSTSCTHDFQNDKEASATDCINPMLSFQLAPLPGWNISHPVTSFSQSIGQTGAKCPGQNKDTQHINTDGFQGKNAEQWTPLKNWPNVAVAGCSMSLCARSMRSTVEKGRFKETVIDELPLLAFVEGGNDLSLINSFDNTLPINDINFLPSPCHIKGEEYALKKIVDMKKIAAQDEVMKALNIAALQALNDIDRRDPGIGNIYRRNATWIEANAILNRTLYDACGLKISQLAADAMGKGLPDGGASAYTDATVGKSWEMPYLNPWIDGPSEVVWGAQTQLHRLYNSGFADVASISRNWDELATALSQYMRQNDANASTVIGSVTYGETCVRINFPWLILPLVLVLLSIGFLAVTLLETRRQFGHGRIDWKSSQIALLFSGLSEDSRREVGALETQSEMMARGDELKVRLEPTDQTGWRLVEHSPSIGSTAER